VIIGVSRRWRREMCQSLWVGATWQFELCFFPFFFLYFFLPFFIFSHSFLFCFFISFLLLPILGRDKGRSFFSSWASLGFSFWFGSLISLWPF
jgi:hypothetical protein